MGRSELALGVSGAITVRDTGLIPLMYAERGVVRYGGAKRLNRFLSAEQRVALEALPPLVATVESLIDFHIAVAREFTRRGRALALRTASAWPEVLERAVLEHLSRMLGGPVDL